MDDVEACGGFWWMLVMSGTVGRPGTGIYLHDVGGREPPQIYDRKVLWQCLLEASLLPVGF